MVREYKSEHQTFEVLGVAKIPYIGKGIDGHNCEFKEYPKLLIGWQLLLMDQHKLRYQLDCWEEEGQCCSGWTKASWGKFNLNRLTSGLPLTHIPREPLTINIHKDSITSNFLTIDRDGGDEYYPYGHVSMVEDFLTPTGRGHENPITYILFGSSNTGKSTIGHKINLFNEYGTYETDSGPELPDVLPHGVIVLGNKYKHSITNIRRRISNVGIPIDVIEVGFHEEG